MFRTKVVEKIKTRILSLVNLYFVVPFIRKYGKILYRGAGHRWQYSSCTLHAGYL